MTRWLRIAIAGVLAGGLALMLPAMLPSSALSQTADEPSIFKSLWSKIKRAVAQDNPDSGDPAIAGPPVAADSGESSPAATPSLSGARWIGFTPVIVAGKAAGAGAWIAGPFVEAGDTVWVTDTVSGLTVGARLVWRETAEGSLAELSAEAGKGLGLLPGAVANVAIFLAR